MRTQNVAVISVRPTRDLARVKQMSRGREKPVAEVAGRQLVASVARSPTGVQVFLFSQIFLERAVQVAPWPEK